MSFVQKCTREDVEEATYTSRQLNSLSARIQGYNFVTHCTMIQQPSVVQVSTRGSGTDYSAGVHRHGPLVNLWAELQQMHEWEPLQRVSLQE